MDLKKAQALAEGFCFCLAPFCQRIEIAGSIRRRKPDVGDIEVVCIPNRVMKEDLFGNGETERDPRFAKQLSKYKILKGSPTEGKFIQIELSGITVDIFTAVPDNWGLIFAIRTGSADFSHHFLASGWVMAGYHSSDGFLCKPQGLGKKTIPVREEKDLFELIKLPWVPPENRFYIRRREWTLNMLK